MSKIKLRPYQEQGLVKLKEALVNNQKVVAVSPVGSGKSILIVNILLSNIKKGKKVLILVHTRVLIDQLSQTFKSFGIGEDLLSIGAKEPHKQVQLSTMQTFTKKTELFPKGFFIGIIDECHISGAKTYINILNKTSLTYLIGFTATPFRLDGTPLSIHFKKLIEIVDPQYLLDHGYWCPLKIYSVAQGIGKSSLAFKKRTIYLPKNLNEILKEYETPYIKAIIFCESVETAESIHTSLKQAGRTDSQWIASKRPTKINKQIIYLFKNTNKFNILITKNMLIEGFDVPKINLIVMLRYSNSPVFYTQALGRALRPHPDKKESILLDFTSNSNRFPSPAFKQFHSLTNNLEKKKKGTHKCCKECSYWYKIALNKCPKCFAPWQIQQIEENIVEKEKDFKFQNKKLSLIEELHYERKMKGYQVPWLYHRLKAFKYSKEDALFTIKNFYGYKENWIVKMREILK